MIKFKQGQELSSRSICDYNCIYTSTVLNRTAKTVTINVRGENKRCKVHESEGVEFIYPFGKYSMCPVFKADKATYPTELRSL